MTPPTEQPGTDQQRLVRQLRLDADGVEVLIGPHTARTLREAAEALEQAATDAARIVELERERDDAVAQSRIDCTAYEALQVDAVELARRNEELEQALREIVAIHETDHPMCDCAKYASAALRASHE